MNNRSKIKVIKKGDPKVIKTPEIAEATSEEDAAKLVSMVSVWIDEFQQRRREETETANEQFYR
jgi:hypothetical protein